MNTMSIKQRLFLIISTALFSLVCVSILAMSFKRDSMMDERKNQLQVLVESAYSMVDFYYKKAESGLMSEEMAKQRAMTAVGAMLYGNNGYFMIYNHQSTMLYHPRQPELIGKDLSRLQDVNGVYIIQDQINAAKRGGGFVEYQWQKNPSNPVLFPKMTYSKSFDAWQWVLNTGIYIDDVDEAFYTDVARFMGFTLAIAILLITISLYISQSIVSPIEALQKIFRKVESDLDLSARIHIEGKNELSKLGDDFNNLMITFEDTLATIVEGANELNRKVGNLESLSNHIVGASTRQSEDTVNIAALVEEFSASINTISHDANTMRTLSNESGSQAEEGALTMRQTIANMDQMSEKSSQSSHAVSELDKHSKEIEGIVSVINDVAEQTNLLALNAAIEAARAGDQGRGFAVVADEVRNLAVRTSDSTKQIAQTIQELRAGIEETVGHIESSVSVVNENMTQTHSAEESVREMHKKSNALIDIIEEVSRSLNEQTSANHELGQRIQAIADMASNNHQSASEVQNSAREMNELVDAFQRTVGRFKLSEV